MDPNAVLARFLNALNIGDRAEVAEALSTLQEWIAKGGFLPDDPRDVSSLSSTNAYNAFVGNTALTEAEFAEMKLRYPNHVTDDDRVCDFATLLRLIEERN